MPDEMTPYDKIISAIIKRFIRLVGAPAALTVARRIPNLVVDQDGNVLQYDQRNPLPSITQLIDEYGSVFGEVAVTLSRQATRPLADLSELVLQETGLAPEPRNGPTRILIVDDHALFRDGLTSLINPQSDMVVVGHAGTMKEAVSLARELEPDLVMMDMSLPDGTGVEATKAILLERPDIKIVMLTVHEDDEHLFSAIRAGAVGYLLKNIRTAELLKRMRSVAGGEVGVSPMMTQRIFEEFSQTAKGPSSDILQSAGLTAREMQIVFELARGASNRQIAKHLVISENTVKNHVRNVLTKLRLRSRYDVERFVRKYGLKPTSADDAPN